MNTDRMDGLLRDIDDFAVRAEVREFAMRPTDEQNVRLYLELREIRREVTGLKGGPSKTGIAALATAALLALMEARTKLGG